MELDKRRQSNALGKRLIKISEAAFEAICSDQPEKLPELMLERQEVMQHLALTGAERQDEPDTVELDTEVRVELLRINQELVNLAQRQLDVYKGRLQRVMRERKIRAYTTDSNTVENILDRLE